MKKGFAKLGIRDFLFFLIFVSAMNIAAIAQGQPPPDVAPAPEMIISKGEKEQLEKIKEVKARTSLSISLMESRLAKAEELVQSPDFPSALSNLGSYEALMADCYDFLKKNDTESGKVKNNFKKLEIILRKHTVRLELLRREMSYKYSWHVGRLMKAVREIRANAVEPLFSDDVVKGSL